MAKSQKITCRVPGCVDKQGNQRQMNRSSYKEHLISKHPSENPNDQRGYCVKTQQSILDSFSNSSKRKTRQEEEAVTLDEGNPDKEDRQDETEYNEELNLEEDQSERDDIGDNEELNLGEKLSNVEDEMEVSAVSSGGSDADELNSTANDSYDVNANSVPDMNEILKLIETDREVSVDVIKNVSEENVGKIVQFVEVKIKESLNLMSQKDKLVLLANLERIAVHSHSEGIVIRLSDLADVLLNKLSRENWHNISSWEAYVLSRFLKLTTCRIPPWIRAVLNGLLERVVEGDLENQLSRAFSAVDRLNEKLETVIKNIVANPPNLSNFDTAEACERKIDIISSQVRVGNIVGNLSKALSDLKAVSCIDDNTESNDDEKTTVTALNEC